MVFESSRRIACRAYEARLEDALSGSSGALLPPDLAAHVERCVRCREALEAARLGRELLRETREPARPPEPAFSTRVLAGIRAEESRRAVAAGFWRPLEWLATRLAVVAAMILLVLSAYLYEASSARQRRSLRATSEVTDGFPQPAQQPASDDEVLLTLAENSHVR